MGLGDLFSDLLDTLSPQRKKRTRDRILEELEARELQQQIAAIISEAPPGASQMDIENQIILVEATNFFGRHFSFRNGRGIGSGAYGSAILFEETLPSGTRKVVVKVARTEFDNMSIRSEEGFLQSLRGAEHIVQILYSGPGTFYRSSLVIEFVEHGHWEDIYERIHDAGRSIPNRVLWGIFLCLTRAVIAMAWPPNRNLGDPIWRETIQSKDPGLMAHRDFSLGNVLVGAWQKTDPEHRFSPITKVIDFGLAINMTPKEPLGNRRGIADNIAGIGRVISWLAGRHPAFEDRDEHLSDELQEMIFRCTDKDVEERPTLEELLEACENVVKNHTATDYQHLPSGQYEQDHEIDQFIQTFILNADI